MAQEYLKKRDKNLIISKLRKLIVTVWSSPQWRDKFAAQCGAFNLTKKELILDVNTRWNSTYAIIECALELAAVSILVWYSMI